MGLNDLQYGQQLNEILRRRYGIQEQPAPAMATEFFPMVVLEAERPEWLYYGAELRSSFYHFDAAVAGQYSMVGVQVGAGDVDLLVVIEKVLFYNNGGAGVFVRPGFTDNPNLLDNLFLTDVWDSRWQTTKRGQASVIDRTQAAVPIVRDFGTQFCPVGVTELPFAGVVIGSPNIFGIMGDVVNQSVDVYFQWRERKLEVYEHAET